MPQPNQKPPASFTTPIKTIGTSWFFYLETQIRTLKYGK